MTDQDAFFTQTIVGAPFSVLMGRRAERPDTQDLMVDMADGQARLSNAWQVWALDRLAEHPPGCPRRRPSALRRWLERHALAIAALGLMALLIGGALAAWSVPAVRAALSPLMPLLRGLQPW